MDSECQADIEKLTEELRQYMEATQEFLLQLQLKSTLSRERYLEILIFSEIQKQMALFTILQLMHDDEWYRDFVKRMVKYASKWKPFLYPNYPLEEESSHEI